MKLFYIFFVICITVLAFGSFYYTNMRKDITDFKATKKISTSESIYIYREYGDVSFKNKTSSTYTPLTSEKMLIPNYSSVKTGDGRGYIIFPDNSSITLSTSTEIEISYTPNSISIMQIVGSTYHRVMSYSKGNTYEVRTPNTLATIRGTKFAVIYDPIIKKTFLVVTEHNVEVTQTKENGTVIKAPVIVQEGSLAEIKSSTSTTKVGTSTSQEEDSVIIRTTEEVSEVALFIDENKTIDKEYNKVSFTNNKNKNLEMIIQSLKKGTQGVRPVENEVTSTPETATKTIQRLDPPKNTKIDAPTSINETPSVLVKTPTTTITYDGNLSGVVVPKASTSLRKLSTSTEEMTPADENFINTFYATYEQYFLVDDPVTYCEKVKKMSSKDFLGALLTITDKANILLPQQQELEAFASDLVASCTDGSIGYKIPLFKTRFDVVYPY